SFGASSLQLEIGLGNATAVEGVEVRWPAGEPERFEGLGLDAAFRLLEGSGRAEDLAWTPIRTTGSTTGGHGHEGHGREEHRD
ncbi:MAG: ASPIC/UnbV domain-containing protein, partial [Holophagales bacterium]|nr:ASPIC/UnbV domain-containing protein [Holophagales bacterium]